jgi:hypothetical protein
MAEQVARVAGGAYLVNSCEPGDLSEAERAACVAISKRRARFVVGQLRKKSRRLSCFPLCGRVVKLLEWAQSSGFGDLTLRK